MPPAQRRLLGKGLQLGHQVVVDLGFDLQGARHVEVRPRAAQIGYLLWLHQAELGLHFGQRHPDLPPQRRLWASLQMWRISGLP